MTINLHLPAKAELLSPTITVIGVGGAGGNAVNNMIASNLEGVNFVVANTDAQALDHSLTDCTVQLGAGITKGLGAGANPDVGRAAAEEASEEISAYIQGSNMVFITAGMGGGTGTGAAPVVARIAKEQGILTVAVVTKPFQFEGTHRMRLAESGLKELQEYVDTLIIIPNQNLFRIANERTTFADAFKMADEVLHSGVRGVTDLMVKPGLINLDFADIRTVMREMGKAMMGTGEATGDRRAIEAAEAAISNPLLDDVSLKGARALLINITGGSDMTLFEVDEAANRIREEVDPEANIIFGSAFNDAMEGKMRVSVVATGIDAQHNINQLNQKNAAPAESKKPYAYAPTGVSKVDPVKVLAQRTVPVVEPVQSQAPRIVEPAFANAISTPVAAVSPAIAAPMFSLPPRQPVDMQQPQAQPQQERQPELAQAVQHHMPQPVTAAIAATAEPAVMPVQIRPAAPAPRIVEMASEYTRAAVDERPMMREPASAANPYEMSMERPVASGSAAARRDMYRDAGREEAKSFFQRMADVGRALSPRHEQRPEAGERVQVVQKNVSAEPAEKASRLPNEDQYLDIPAFLRRQAN